VDLLKLNKRSWGWQEQDTALITYLDLPIATVSSLSGSPLSFSRSSRQGYYYSCAASTATAARDSSYNLINKAREQTGAEYYRIGVEIGGGGGIDPDLRQLYVVGSKDRDSVYYKCFANSLTEEVVAVYRFHRSYRFHRNRSNGNSNGGGGEGELHVVGRGNRAGLRHLIVCVLCSLGFTTAV
jgi:hypothetical protein